MTRCNLALHFRAENRHAHHIAGIQTDRLLNTKTNDQRIYYVVLHSNGKAFAFFSRANAKRSAMRAAGKTGSVRRVTGAELYLAMRR